MVRGKSLPEALRLAADFTLACIQATCRDPNAPWYGVEFEKALHLQPRPGNFSGNFAENP